VTWLRYGKPKPADGDNADPLLDSLMPACDIADRRLSFRPASS
jgi:hypothetical protein